MARSVWLSGSLCLCSFAACSDGGATTFSDASIISLGDTASPSQVSATSSDAGAPTGTINVTATMPDGSTAVTTLSDSGATSSDAASATAAMDAGAISDSTVASPDEAGAMASDSGAADADSGSPTAPMLDGGGDGGGRTVEPDASQPSDAGVRVDYTKKGPYAVVTEKNVGAAFRNDVSDDTLFCNLFIGALGGSNPDIDKELTSYPSDMNRGLYTLFRPEPLVEGKTYPLLTWGNGTCSHPLLFNELIEHVVSHGFIVIASNSRQVGDGKVMLRGIDFMVSENERKSSPLYGKIDTKMIGAFGHSQGSMATATAGADPRIVTTVPIMGASASDARKLHGPTFLIAGEKDTIVDPAGVKDAYNAATVPAVFGLSLGKDHLMPGLDPEYIWDAVTAWFKIHLAADVQARDLFYGDKCTLCKDPRWQIQRKNL